MNRNERRKELRQIDKDKAKLLSDPDLLNVFEIISRAGQTQANRMFKGVHESTVSNYIIDCQKPKLEKLYLLEKRKEFLSFDAKRNATKLTSRHVEPQEGTPDYPMGEQIF